jgi:hypothetical protein
VSGMGLIQGLQATAECSTTASALMGGKVIVDDLSNDREREQQEDED